MKEEGGSGNPASAQSAHETIESVTGIKSGNRYPVRGSSIVAASKAGFCIPLLLSRQTGIAPVRSDLRLDHFLEVLTV